eukprot:3153515-Pleurochrysis_carterae.AAC.1
MRCVRPTSRVWHARTALAPLRLRAFAALAPATGCARGQFDGAARKRRQAASHQLKQNLQG